MFPFWSSSNKILEPVLTNTLKYNVKTSYSVGIVYPTLTN